MHAGRFDFLTRSLTVAGSRRHALAAAVGGFATLGALPAGAKKDKTKKPKLNEFGCVDVGKACLGKDSNCCSGICQGKKPKKGKKDKSRCAAHNDGGCTPVRSACVVVDITQALCNPAIPVAVCMATTGNAGFCGSLAGFNSQANCRSCTTDTECVAFGFPSGSACVIVQGGGCGDPCAVTNGRACLQPGI